ncbi:MAG: ABC transporter permease [Gammaproteobacteria bacterium]
MSSTEPAANRTDAPQPGFGRILWVQHRLFWRLVWQDIRTTYAGTMLGIGWVIFGPLLLLLLYAIIYAVIFRVRIPNFTIEEYIVNVFSGLVPFLAFAQGLGASTNAIQRGKGLLSNPAFPVDLVPLKPVAGAYVILPVGFAFTFIGDLIFSKVTWTWSFVPLVMLFQMMLSMGIGYILSVISLVVRDLQFLVQYIVIALLVVTPIAYTPNMIPQGLMSLLYLNPLFYSVYSYQNLVLLNTLPPPHIICIGSITSLTIFWAGRCFYRRTRGAIGDFL